MKSFTRDYYESNSHNGLGGSTMAIESLEIEVEPQEINSSMYRPGQNINGKVTIKNPDYIVCRSIRVALEGTAVVSYHSKNSVNWRTKTENLLDYSWATVFLVGTATQGSKQSHLLKKSRHEFPFTIHISKMDTFPGTLNEPYGEIVYRITAYVENYYSKNPATVSEIINIHGNLNLREIPVPVYPVLLNGTAELSYPNERTKFNIQLPRTSFLLWEKIPFKITLIDPEDLDTLPTVYVSLVRRTIFKSDVSSRCTKATLSSCEHPNGNLVDMGTFWNVEWKDALEIPKDTEDPTITEGIIQCLYSIQLELRTNCGSRPFIDEVPVTIGTTR